MRILKMAEKPTIKLTSKESIGTMGSWCAKRKAKGRGSQTPGSAKGPACQADVFKKFMAKRSRSYKDPEYGNWCLAMDKLNKGK